MTKTRSLLRDEQGFSVAEMATVLMTMAILSAMATPRHQLRR